MAHILLPDPNALCLDHIAVEVGGGLGIVGLP
jgi:hypothetical protein